MLRIWRPIVLDVEESDVDEGLEVLRHAECLGVERLPDNSSMVRIELGGIL